MFESVPVESAKAGDLIFCHRKGLIPSLLRLAQSLRWKPGSTWNHVACLDVPAISGNSWFVIQATSKGVNDLCLLSDIAPGGTYEIVQLPSGVDRDKFLAFVRSQVGAKYGFLTVASIAFNIVTPRFISFRKAGTWICSAVQAGGLWFAGWPVVEKWSDLYQVSPAQLYEAIKG